MLLRVFLVGWFNVVAKKEAVGNQIERAQSAENGLSDAFFAELS